MPAAILAAGIFGLKPFSFNNLPLTCFLFNNLQAHRRNGVYFKDLALPTPWGLIQNREGGRMEMTVNLLRGFAWNDRRQSFQIGALDTA